VVIPNHLVAASQVVVAFDAGLVVAHGSGSLVDGFLYGVESLELAGVGGLPRPLDSLPESLDFRLNLGGFHTLSRTVVVSG
jgi:hypothetical protein